MGDQPHRRPRRKYWGLRTLGFLTLALVSVLAMSWTSSALPLLGLLVGLSGATYCTWRGLRDFTWLPR